MAENILMIRTYDPTQVMVERIKRIYSECPDRKFILSINVSLDSFDEVDEINCDYEIPNFSSDDEIIKAVPDLLKRKKYCFVRILDDSEQKKIYRLKQNLIDLIEYFGDSAHIYTEHNIFDRFDKDNLRNMFKKSVAWNYHNECIVLALEQTNGVFIDKINRLWVLEDDLEYTGNFNEFFKEYDSIELDLLEEKSTAKRHLAYYGPCTTSKFKQEIVQEGKIRCAHEHIISMSGRFIEGMRRLLDDGYNGHSEITTISYCYHLNMKYVDIDPKHFSRQFNWRMFPIRNDINVKKLVDVLKKSGEKLLVHPCKY